MNKKQNWALLAARIIIGGIFIFTGYLKVSDLSANAGFFASVGIPAFLSYIVAFGELLGGIAVVLGLWTDVALIGLAIIMLGAIWVTHAMGPQAFMTPVAVLGGLVALFAGGAGNYTLMCMFKKKSE